MADGNHLIARIQTPDLSITWPIPCCYATKRPVLVCGAVTVCIVLLTSTVHN